MAVNAAGSETPRGSVVGEASDAASGRIEPVVAGTPANQEARNLPLVNSALQCCPTGLREPISRASAEPLSQMFKAVADPARLQLIALIRSAPGGESCACDLNEPLGLRQPTVSHHLKVLMNAGLVEREQRGTWAWYSLVQEHLDELAGILAAVPSDS